MMTYALAVLAENNGIIDALRSMQPQSNAHVEPTLAQHYFSLMITPETADQHIKEAHIKEAMTHNIMSALNDSHMTGVVESLDVELQQAEEDSPMNLALLLEAFGRKMPQFVTEGVKKLYKAVQESGEDLEGLLHIGYNIDGTSVEPVQVAQVPFIPNQIYSSEPNQDYFEIPATKDLSDDEIDIVAREIADRVLVDMLTTGEHIYEQEGIPLLEGQTETFDLENEVSDLGRKLLLTDVDGEGSLRDELADYIASTLYELANEEPVQAYVDSCSFNEDMRPNIHLRTFALEEKEGTIEIELPDYSNENVAAMYLDIAKRLVETIVGEVYREDVVWNADAHEHVQAVLETMMPGALEHLVFQKESPYTADYVSHNDRIKIVERDDINHQREVLPEGVAETEAGLIVPARIIQQ